MAARLRQVLYWAVRGIAILLLGFGGYLVVVNGPPDNWLFMALGVVPVVVAWFVGRIILARGQRRLIMDTQKDAEAWFKKGLKATSAPPDHYSEWKSDQNDALAAFDKATSLKSDYAEAWFHKGLVLAELNRHEEAVTANEEVLRLQPENPDAWLHKAVGLGKLERHEEALAANKELLRLRPGDLEARKREVEALGKLGRHAEASFEQGVWWLVLSGSADSVSDLRSERENALAAFDKATSLKSDYAEAWFVKGIVLAGLDRPEEAVVANEEVLRLRPDDAEAWLHKAVALSKLERYEEALAAYEEVLRLWPDDLEAWFRKAEALGKLERYEEAVAAWREVVRSPPDAEAAVHCNHNYFRLSLGRRLLDARFFLGNALASVARHVEAKAAYVEGIKFGGVEIDGAYAPPSFIEALGRFDEARQAYTEKLHSSPRNRSVWKRAGRTFSAAQRAEEALQAYEAAIRLAPDDADAWYGKAEALVQAGRREDAIPAFRQSIHSGSLGAQARLNVVLGELGQPEEPTPEESSGAS